ncbi:putative corA-like Mg2+ transporter protein [Lyophyllum shimeji]|uniref:CorA-like Mg2+ transporter protein n=1 Tax=Lyophyllum shimeji TaxID=47721 RepID=A0A9P3PXT3_LYOSH|nr:putative corA-like Mg2+ transporter protein [Lyophyllum shimeji]
MPRENSFSDSEGRSLTPDLEDEDAPPVSPINSYNSPIPLNLAETSPVLAQYPNPRSPSITKRSILSKMKSPTSQPSVKSPITYKHHPWAGGTPRDRFRAAVRKVIALHRSTSYFAGDGRIGAEPGVNPRRASANLLYGHIRQDCEIEVIDYSSVRSSAGRMTNAEFVNLLSDPAASAKEPWVKVRWINIGGLSWDVIRAVSIKYDLHPLAIEDLFHTRSQNRSKADYYPKHLFLRVLCHELGNGDAGAGAGSESAAYGSTLTDAPRSESPVPHREHGDLEKAAMEQEEEGLGMYEAEMMAKQSRRRRRRFLPFGKGQRDVESMLGGDKTPRSSLARLMSGAAQKRQKRVEHQITLDALKQGERVDVKVSPMFIFLLGDGTVISFHTATTLDFTAAISKRLHQRDTGLRTSADPSLLVHAILDLIVDNALEVIDEYHAKINMFERAVLLKPNAKIVRHLHILSGDLIMHKRTLEPIKTLIYGLRRYDVDRCAALIDMSDPANANVRVVGFMSHKSKIYLADVFDHMEYILSSLDMFAGIAENLIAYAFNLASYEMNQVMRRLTLATIIFLPLTLLTGYFGMNFDPMWSVNKNSDLLFWEIALPVMVIIVPLFMWQDIKGAVHYIRKRMMAKQAVKTIKRE